MTLDRTLAPTINSFEEIILPPKIEQLLKNETKLIVINAGQQPVVRFEIIIDAGNKYESKMGQSFFTAKMLTEGSIHFSSAEIAKKFAEIGYFIEITQGAERMNLTINGLTKYLEPAAKLLIELLTNATFPAKELDDLKRISLQNLAINREKTAYLASVGFKEAIFGADHYIGKTMNEADIEKIERNDLIDFYEEFIKNKSFKIFASGKIDQTEINTINNIFGILNNHGSEIMPELISNTNYYGKQLLVEKIDALQSSIRIGRKMVDRMHSDYFSILVFNTILGGYFGSRLMKNIREEKGYTYGISASYLPIPNHAYMLIGTDVKREYTQQTIDEIFKEIIKLQTEIVPDEELLIVKNFIIGDFAGSINTPFDICDKYKVSNLENLPSNYFNSFVKKIKEVTSQQIIEIAIKYFSRENMLELVVGGK